MIASIPFFDVSWFSFFATPAAAFLAYAVVGTCVLFLTMLAGEVCDFDPGAWLDYFGLSLAISGGLFFIFYILAFISGAWA